MTGHCLLFTDLVDSTERVRLAGDDAAAQLSAEHDRLARQLLAQHGGREIDRSDGFFLLFADAAAGVRFALGYHAAIAGLALKARVGIHVGVVALRENAPEDIARGAKPLEVEGLAKPLAARVMALAQGGQTLLTRAACDALDAAAAPVLSAGGGAQIESHGHYRLKGFDEPAEVFELGAAGCAFAPPPDADKAWRVVRDGEGDLWLPRRQVRHNLAPERDSFVGRSAELRQLAQRLEQGARLLTVLGPGGTGKTRLVRRYALAWLGDWPGGVCFCDLSDAHSAEGIHFALSQALGVPLRKGDAVVQLGHAIAARGRCLVILDNFEQVAGHAAATLGRWLDRAHEAAFVVTSRERLQLPGEEAFAVDPLPLATDALALFEARARMQRPGFVVDAHNRAAVAEVVRLLDGLPLAIELAAARIRVLSPAQIVERLADRFRLLAGARGAAARQATLKAAIDWSWDLLAPWEQAALAQCSAFEGGFTLEAAERVIEVERWPEAPPMIDIVQALVDKSLLRSWQPQGDGRFDIDEPWFGMYLSIREYAAERCTAAGPDARAAVERRHGAWYAALGSDAAIEALSAAEGIARRRALALDLDNLVASCRRAIARGDGACAVPAYRALWEVVNLKGPYALGAELGQALAAMPGLADALRAQALSLAAVALLPIGQLEEARSRLEQALALARGAADRRREAAVLAQLGNVQRWRGTFDEARSCLELAVRMHADAGDLRAQASALSTLGLVSHEHGRVDESQSQYDQALALYRGLGNQLDQASLLNLLGVLHGEQGRLAEAQGHFEGALAIFREAGDRVGEGEVLTNLGCLHQDLQRWDQAVAFFEQSLAIHREVGNRRFEGYVYGDLGRLHLQQREWSASRRCLEQALDIARENGDRRIEGSEWRSLGDLYLRQGLDEQAREALVAGEAVLRQVGDKYYLAHVRCGQAELAQRTGDAGAARLCIDEAQALADATRTLPESDLGRRLAEVRASLQP